ncbi:MAG: DUF2784 domain-containing protein [Candidatus Binatia bacterium]
MLSLSADILLLIHFLYILAVVLPLPLIAIGTWRDWAWVRNFWFRNLHLAAIGYLVYQILAGATCFLTDWEMEWREAAGQPVYAESFIEHWVGRLVYIDLPAEVYAAIYFGFSFLVLLLYALSPPRWLLPTRRRLAHGFHRGKSPRFFISI